MTVFPNAKINLGLRVTRRRPDGYHDIESLMVPIDWCDILEITTGESPGRRLITSGRRIDCPPEANLVMRAIAALENAACTPLPPLDIRLHKAIPDGAGMGGGSADAAFAICAINDLLSLGFDTDRLATVAATVGADCPFFVYNRVAMATGTGTDLTPATEAAAALRRLKLDMVIAKPAEGVSTREAYAGITPRLRGGEPSATEIVASTAPEYWEESGLVNDFEASVIPHCPTIGRAKATMKALGASYAAMTGSGSAVVGLFRPECDILSAQADKAFPGCDTFVAPLVAD